MSYKNNRKASQRNYATKSRIKNERCFITVMKAFRVFIFYSIDIDAAIFYLLLFPCKNCFLDKMALGGEMKTDIMSDFNEQAYFLVKMCTFCIK